MFFLSPVRRTFLEETGDKMTSTVANGVAPMVEMLHGLPTVSHQLTNGINTWVE